MVPNRIRLISHGRYEENTADGVSYPGHLLMLKSTGKVAVHATQGERIPIRIAEESPLYAGKSKDDAFADGDMVPNWLCVKGDVMLFRLQSGQNVAKAAKLMSAGDGTLMALTQVLADVVADSTDITNVTAETTFSNGTVTIPANTLKAGDVIRIRGTAVVTAQNSTNTHRVKVKLGSTVIADSGAVALAANDTVQWDLFVTVRTIGASGTYVVGGTITFGTPGTATTRAVNVASTAIDTTAANTLTVTSTASAQSTGNVIKLSQLYVSEGADTAVALVEAMEAIDNSAGATPFIRGLVI